MSVLPQPDPAQQLDKVDQYLVVKIGNPGDEQTVLLVEGPGEGSDHQEDGTCLLREDQPAEREEHVEVEADHRKDVHRPDLPVKSG